MSRINVLFVCSRNQWRSPTAEAINRKDDDYRFMDPDLVGLIRSATDPLINTLGKKKLA